MARVLNDSLSTIGAPWVMKSVVHFFGLALGLALLLGGCDTGSSAPPPNDVKVAAGDGSVTVTWAMEPGVEYWLFSAAVEGVRPENCSSLPECKTIMAAVSPQVVTGLANGTTYSFTINGRVNGGPGGPGSVPVSATPRIAGVTWSAGSPLYASDLRGVAYGTAFLAAGSGGAVFTSADALVWTVVNVGIATDLKAVAYGNASYVVAGSDGVLLLGSSDLATWTQAASGTSSDLHGLAYVNGLFLAVGANGTLITSADGATWTLRNSGTASHLYGIAYGNGMYVAVGAGGTILTSADAATWQTSAAQTTLDLKGVAYGAGTFIAVGASGSLLTSPDGVAWTLQTPIAVNTALNAIHYGNELFGSQFVAVGDLGVIYTSVDGVSWASPASGSSSNLFAIAYGNYGYSAVGSAGTNLSSF